MVHKEDRIAPIDERELRLVLCRDCEDRVNQIKFLDKLFAILNERQDGYFGLITNISQIGLCDNAYMKTELTCRLAKEITRIPPSYACNVLSTKIFPKLSTICPTYVTFVLEPILLNPEKWFHSDCDQEDVLAVQILILKFLKVAEESKEGIKTTISAESIQTLLKRAIEICDDKTKLDAITLALESRQSTRILTIELPLFKIIFVDALSFQEPSHRQKFLALTSKLINRIKDSYSTATRYKKLSPEKLEETLSYYNEFLAWLIDICFNNIYFNAYFGSFVLTLSTLKIIAEVITFDDSRFSIIGHYNQKICFESILGCLTDSFEENKQLALDLIYILCKNKLFSIEPSLTSLRKIAYELSGCVNPASSLTAKYIFKMLIELSPHTNSRISKTDCLFDNLNTLANLTENNINISKNNFIYGSANHPIYPMLTCMRALLEEIDIVEVYKNLDNWKELIKKIISLLVDACDIVSVLVCNLNPESIGHLPMDIKPVTIDSMSKAFNVSLKISDTKYQTITSQMLLISGWKTIKECSLSMGLMCTRLWWPHPCNNTVLGTLKTQTFHSNHEPLIEFSSIARMIDFFNHYLRNLRHRGAFEQAYNGFVMLTKRVWSEERCRKLLLDSLKSLMLDFKGEYDCEENEHMIEGKIKTLKAYTTRRSAGLPFMIQAILVSEPRRESENLKWVIDCIFSILNNNNTEEYQKVHSLNILKALINEHQLSEKVAPYIEQTFIATIKSFGSESFPMRNCANMLLSSVVGRTFGCSRLKNNIHRKNKLSFECFFSRYPSMLEVMLQYLSYGLKSRHHLASIHTIIILLNRLHPSIDPSDKYTHEKIIQPFIYPMVEVCFRCPDLNLRKIAAKLNVKLEYFYMNYSFPNNLYKEINSLKLINDLLSDTSKFRSTRENQLHGSILILNEWIKLDDLRDQPYYHDLIHIITTVTEQMIETMMDIFIEHKNFSHGLMCELVNLMESYIVRILHSDIREKRSPWKLNLPKNLLFSLNKDDPSLEEFSFKYFQILIMSGLEFDNLNSQDVESLFVALLSEKPNRMLSTNFHSALLRWFRLLNSIGEQFDELENILSNLDADLLTIHKTVFDISNDTNHSEYDRSLYKNYIDDNLTKINLHELEKIHKYVFELINMNEFEQHKFCNHRTQSVDLINTPRAIEVLALMSTLANQVDFNQFKWAPDDDGSLVYKLGFLVRFIKSIPDCDVKFVALFCSSKLVEVMFDESPSYNINVSVFEEWSQLLECSSDVSTCLLSRQVTANILRTTLHFFLQQKNNRQTLVNLLSATIRLINDDEYYIRLLALKGVSKLHRLYGVNELVGTTTQKFIHIIVKKIFNPDRDTDFKHCCELLIKFIFNVFDTFDTEVELDDRERMFDKCKLNTCADCVSIIAEARQALGELILTRMGSIHPCKVQLEDINLPAYSLVGNDCTSHYDSTDGNNFNLSMLERSSLLILEDLQTIVGGGYRRILLDNGNSLKEFSIYKRTALVSLALDLWPNESIRSELREGFEIAYQDCSTNLLKRCLDFLN